MKTGAVAPEVGRINPGKLQKDLMRETDELSKEVIDQVANDFLFGHR